MTKKYLFIISILLSTFSISYAQTAIHQWTTHAPAMKVVSVDMMKDKIFAATPYEVFYYNTNDNSINKLSKVNGLSDFGVSVIRHNPHTNHLFVGYSNTNIDLIDNDDNVININDIKNKNIIGTKTINDVYFIDHLAYVCCSFGIVVVDMNRKEIHDTYIIGKNGTYINVNDITLYNNKLYAATSNGVYYADYPNEHLADFSQWTLDTSMQHHDINYSEIETFNNKLYANYSDNQWYADTLFVYDGESWDYYDKSATSIKREIRAYEDRMLFVEHFSASVVDVDNMTIMYFTSIEPFAGIYDRNRNVYWIGDATNSLVKMKKDKDYEYVRFNGPYSNSSFEIKAKGDRLWVASGGYTLTWAKRWLNDGVSFYDNNSWSYLNRENVEALDTITDLVCIAFDPTNDSKVYVGSYDAGILEFEDCKLKNIYDDRNSSLGKLKGYDYVYVTGMDFDSDNNLWVANSKTDKMLSVKTANGDWYSYSVGDNYISRLMVDDNDYKWILTRDGTFIVFNDNNTLSYTADDRYKIISTREGQGGLPQTANCMATDHNGTVWVGTADGLAMFTSTSRIFESGANYDATRILVPRNDGSGQADYLLSGESVLSIAVDGANNLWIGTTNGVFYIANNGLTEYHHFTQENSPLLSNTVKDIAIDDDGNVFFATDNGIISFRGKATTGKERNSEVVVFPNPVRQGYSGLVGIKNLTTNALVKITTIDGSFVTHLYAEGGQAVWDCTTIDGQRVEPGIYLIFISDESGNKEHYATKVLVQ